MLNIPVNMAKPYAAIVNPVPGHVITEARTEGFKDALEEAGVNVDVLASSPDAAEALQIMTD